LICKISQNISSVNFGGLPPLFGLNLLDIYPNYQVFIIFYQVSMVGSIKIVRIEKKNLFSKLYSLNLSFKKKKTLQKGRKFQAKFLEFGLEIFYSVLHFYTQTHTKIDKSHQIILAT